jgi:Der1-like family
LGCPNHVYRLSLVQGSFRYDRTIHVWNTIQGSHAFNFSKGLYLPAVMTVFSLVMGGDIRGDLLGIVIGHLYFFLVNVMNVNLSAPDVMYLFLLFIFS